MHTCDNLVLRLSPGMHFEVNIEHANRRWGRWRVFKPAIIIDCVFVDKIKRGIMKTRGTQAGQSISWPPMI